MTGAIDSALNGMLAGLSRMDQAAGRMARQDAASDPARDAVDLMQAEHEVRANAAVIRTADATVGTLLDVLA